MREKLGAVFKKLFNTDGINDDMTPENVEDWDSFSQIELIMEIESAFGITIPTADAVKLNSAKNIIEYLQSKGL